MDILEVVVQMDESALLTGNICLHNSKMARVQKKKKNWGSNVEEWRVTIGTCVYFLLFICSAL